TNLSIADLLQKMYQWLSQLMKKIKNEFSKKKISKHKETISKKKKSEEKPIEPAVQFAYEEENHEQKTLTINDEKKKSEKEKNKKKTIEPAVHIANKEENHEQLTLTIKDEKEKSEKEESEFTPVIQTENDNSNYILPTMALLKNPLPNNQQQEKSAIKNTVKVLEDTFVNFGVKATVSNV